MNYAIMLYEAVRELVQEDTGGEDMYRYLRREHPLLTKCPSCQEGDFS